MRNFIILLLLVSIVPVKIRAQQMPYYRMSADFTIKEKNTDGRSSLTMGRVYYDSFYKKIVYSIRFPEKETWLFYDTSMYKIAGKDMTSYHVMPGFVDFSIFNLALNNNLKNYGLQKSVYTMKKVEKDEDLVISTWVPRKEVEKKLGILKIAVGENKLNGIIFYDPKNKIIGKQLFTNYANLGGFEFPTEIMNYSYRDDGSEIHQLTTYKNIKVNNWDENSFYNYPVPGK